MLKDRSRFNMIRDGIILVDKPGNLTSHDVVDIIRRRLNTRRIGHAGTLDPVATGLLILLVGRATKQFNRFANFDKEYHATLELGIATDSGDSQGQVTQRCSYDNVTEEKVAGVLKNLEGAIELVPPMVSAIKY